MAGLYVTVCERTRLCLLMHNYDDDTTYLTTHLAQVLGYDQLTAAERRRYESDIDDKIAENQARTESFAALATSLLPTENTVADDK